jgi:hypothetical protein
LNAASCKVSSLVGISVLYVLYGHSKISEFHKRPEGLYEVIGHWSYEIRFKCIATCLVGLGRSNVSGVAPVANDEDAGE